MGRIVDYNATGKTIAASTTVTFTSSDIPSSGVVAYHVTMTGVGNSFNAIDRIRVKANGIVFYDITSALFRSFVQRWTNGGTRYPAGNIIQNLGTPGTAVNWRRFTIPFCMLDYEKHEEQDVCQFPVGSNVTIEIVFNANGVAGSAFCGWTETDVHPRCWPKLYSNQMNIGASQTNGRYAFAEDGVLRGFGIETTGLSRFRAVANGRQIYHAAGQPADSASVTEDAMFLETEQVFGLPTPALAGGTAAQDNSVQDPSWIKVHAGETGSAGRTFVELGTTTAFVGAASELGIYAIVPYKQ